MATVGSTLKAAYQRPLTFLDTLGAQLAFYVKAIAWTPRTIRRYKKEILRLLAEVTLGSGALAVIGGTVGVITAMSFFTGTEVGLQGYAALNQIGTAAFSGFVSAYFNTREIAPLVAGIALAATVGCGFTAQLGAMRISEEVDALEVMAIPSMPFLVATRVVGGHLAAAADERAGGPGAGRHRGGRHPRRPYDEDWLPRSTWNFGPPRTRGSTDPPQFLWESRSWRVVEVPYWCAALLFSLLPATRLAHSQERWISGLAAPAAPFSSTSGLPG